MGVPVMTASKAVEAELKFRLNASTDLTGFGFFN
jgi:hypothetical protein